MNTIISAKEKYRYWLENWSDIQDHLPMLHDEAKGNVVELGVRDGVSTSALLAGVEAKGGKVFSVDIDSKCWEIFDGHPNWIFRQGSSVAIDELSPHHTLLFGEHELKDNIDLLFIDTEHTFKQCYMELMIWGVHVKRGGKILLHDVITFPMVGRAVEIWARENGKSCDFIQGSNGLGVIYV